MARIFISGSSQGLGLTAAQLLVEQGHQVVLHARNRARAQQVQQILPKAQAVVIGDLSSIAETCDLAEQVNQLGRFDAVIHNAGIGYREPRRVETIDGLPQVFAVNTLAPYILTALIEKPQRLIYLSSLLHRHTAGNLEDLLWQQRPWNGQEAYSETKFHDLLLAFAIARYWPEVKSNALEPGWVATRMGGAQATDDLDAGHRTQVWLAVSDDALATGSGGYFYHQQPQQLHPQARNIILQDSLINSCASLSGISLER